METKCRTERRRQGDEEREDLGLNRQGNKEMRRDRN